MAFLDRFWKTWAAGSIVCETQAEASIDLNKQSWYTVTLVDGKFIKLGVQLHREYSVPIPYESSFKVLFKLHLLLPCRS